MVRPKGNGRQGHHHHHHRRRDRRHDHGGGLPTCTRGTTFTSHPSQQAHSNYRSWSTTIKRNSAGGEACTTNTTVTSPKFVFLQCIFNSGTEPLYCRAVQFLSRAFLSYFVPNLGVAGQFPSPHQMPRFAETFSVRSRECFQPRIIHDLHASLSKHVQHTIIECKFRLCQLLATVSLRPIRIGGKNCAVTK